MAENYAIIFHQLIKGGLGGLKNYKVRAAGLISQ